MADTTITAGQVLAPFQTVASITDRDFFLMQIVNASGTIQAGRVLVPNVRAALTSAVSQAVIASIAAALGGEIVVTTTSETAEALAEVFGSSSSSSSS